MNTIIIFSLLFLLIGVLTFIGFYLIFSDANKENILTLESFEELKENNALLNQKLGSIETEKKDLSNSLLECYTTIQRLKKDLDDQEVKTKKIESAKKSGEVRLGLAAETLTPFLSQFPYKPADCQFLGAPVDFIVFNIDAGEIVVVEVKSGNARESKKQKTIKEIIKSGRVYYECIRINENGVKITREENV